jgi:four helix bundle protein
VYTYAFEKLEVWKEAKSMVVWIYQITSNFPDSEKFGLTGQMRRAAISIISNLAEGSARISFKDKAHFSQIAYSSNIEILNQLIIAFELDFISVNCLSEGRSKSESISKKIASLRKSQLNPKP